MKSWRELFNNILSLPILESPLTLETDLGPKFYVGWATNQIFCPNFPPPPKKTSHEIKENWSWGSGGSRGGAQGMCPPSLYPLLGQKNLHFHAVLGKTLPNNTLASLKDWCPLSGKYWIRYFGGGGEVIASGAPSKTYHCSCALFLNTLHMVDPLLSIVCKLFLHQPHQLLSEMHRTQTEFENQLIYKVFVFQFVNFYSSIIYIGFFKGRYVSPPGG